MTLALTPTPTLTLTRQVWKVFDNPRLRQLRLSNSRLLAYLALGILIELLGALVFGLVQPLKVSSKWK